MAGVRLATAIRDRWPPIEIVLTSGALVPPAERMSATGVFLAKPCSKRQLEAALAEFIDLSAPV